MESNLLSDILIKTKGEPLCLSAKYYKQPYGICVCTHCKLWKMLTLLIPFNLFKYILISL